MSDLVERLRAHGSPADYETKLHELYDWTGSAFLAGEKVKHEAYLKGELYSFLCGLLGYLTCAAETAQAAEEAAAELTRLRSEKAELVAERDALKKTIGGCQWYWPEDDTSEDNCTTCPQEVVESLYGWCTPTGEVVAVARGGIVEITYCAALPPAEDADSDDEFWVEEGSQEAAQAKVDAELQRRESLSRVSGGAS